MNTVADLLFEQAFYTAWKVRQHTSQSRITGGASTLPPSALSSSGCSPSGSKRKVGWRNPCEGRK